jgi:hypothetical protein
LKAHLARVALYDVRLCKRELQSDRWADMYRRQWENYLEKKLGKKSVKQQVEVIMEARNAKGVEAYLSAGATRNAIKAKQALVKAGLKAPPPGSDAKLASDAKLVRGQQKMPGSAHNNTALDCQVNSFIHRAGLSFSIAQHPDFRACLKLARNASADYEPPSRNAIGGHLLKQEFEARYDENIEKLLKEIETYGGALFCDAATIHKSPLVNVLGSGVHLPNAVLEIHDCTGHMTEGGKKDAEYLFKLVMKHMKKLDPHHQLIDLLVFDGGSNFQKCGKMVEEVCPMVTTIHGGEHIMSLGFSDIAKTRLGGMFVKLCRIIYKWFGGRHHALYALFCAYSKLNNNGIPIGLIRPADTRMGGYWIALTRIYRMKAVFEQMLVSQQFTQK